MKLTKENYKEVIDNMCKIKNNKQVFYYHHSYLSYATLENYAFEKGVLINDVLESGSIRKITYRKHI